MTDTTAPIIDIQGYIFWDEVFDPQTQQPVLRPVRTEIRYQRMGYEEWEVVRYQNIVPDKLGTFPANVANQQMQPEEVQGTA